MAVNLIHETRACEEALGSLLSGFPYDSVSKYAINDGFDPSNPHFRLHEAKEAQDDNLRFGTGANCVILPQILSQRLATKGLTSQLIADETRSHVVLCVQGESGRYIICDPGLLCVRPFVVTPDAPNTEIHIVENPGGNDRFGFNATLDRENGRFAITKNKAKTDTQITYQFDLAELGNTEAVRATDIKDTLSVQIPVISKLVMPRIGMVASVDAISVRDNRGKVKDFAHRTGIDALELWRRLDVGNRVRRQLQATNNAGTSINWTY